MPFDPKETMRTILQFAALVLAVVLLCLLVTAPAHAAQVSTEHHACGPGYPNCHAVVRLAPRGSVVVPLPARRPLVVTAAQLPSTAQKLQLRPFYRGIMAVNLTNHRLYARFSYEVGR